MNVWLALTLDWHVHNERSRSWFATLSAQSAVFCRISQMGFLRLLTNSKVMGEDVRTQRQAWSVYEELLRDHRVLSAGEPASFDERWKSLSSRPAPAHSTWTDDYLAAFAGLAGFQIVTFDAGFSRYSGGLARIL